MYLQMFILYMISVYDAIFQISYVRVLHVSDLDLSAFLSIMFKIAFAFCLRLCYTVLVSVFVHLMCIDLVLQYQFSFMTQIYFMFLILDPLCALICLFQIYMMFFFFEALYDSMFRFLFFHLVMKADDTDLVICFSGLVSAVIFR